MIVLLGLAVFAGLMVPPASREQVVGCHPALFRRVELFQVAGGEVLNLQEVRVGRRGTIDSKVA